MRTTKEFNTQYKDYLSEDFTGINIEFPAVIHYVNELFKDFIKIPGFKFESIFLVYGLPSVRTNLDEILPFVGRIIHQEMEEKITLLLKVEFEVEQRLLSLNLDKNGKPLQSL